VFDVTRASTFEAVQKWKNDLDSKVMLPNGAPIPVVLLANKVCCLSRFHSNATKTFCSFKNFCSHSRNHSQTKRLLLITIFSFFLQCDQAKEGLVNNASQMDEYCSDKGFNTWFETSAKEDINISEAAKYLVAKVHENIDRPLPNVHGFQTGAQSF